MGTQRSSDGPGGGVPLVPPWVLPVELPNEEGQPAEVAGEDATEAPPKKPTEQTQNIPSQPVAPILSQPGRFRSARTSLGHFASSGSRRDLESGLGHYIRSGLGGAAQGFRRMGGTPQCRSSFNLQREVFDRILIRCADLGGRIMSIHSRQAGKEVLNALENHPQSGKAVLHWFSGSKRELERAIELGTWFSVGPITCGVFGALCVKSVRFMTLIEAPRFLNVLTKGIS